MKLCLLYHAAFVKYLFVNPHQQPGSSAGTGRRASASAAGGGETESGVADFLGQGEGEVGFSSPVKGGGGKEGRGGRGGMGTAARVE